MFRNLQKKYWTCWLGPRRFQDIVSRERVCVLARNLVFTIPWGNLNQVCSKQTSSTGTLGSTPERTHSVGSKQLFNQTPVQAYVASKRPAMCRHHCLRFKQNLDALQTPKSFSSMLAAKICRTLWVHKELGTLINSSFYSLLTLGDFAISSPQQKLDIAGGCTATSPYITSKKLWSKGRLHKKV